MPDPTSQRSANRHSPARQAAGWAVHAFTASGAILGLLAMLAVFRGEPRTALLWLGLGLAVDGLDGPIARRVHVREVIPASTVRCSTSSSTT